MSYVLTEEGRKFMGDYEEYVEGWLMDTGRIPSSSRILLGTLWDIDDTGELPFSSEYINCAFRLMERGFVEEVPS